MQGVAEPGASGGIPQQGVPAAGPYVAVPAWLASAASGTAAWVPVQGWGAATRRLLDVFAALPLASLLLIAIAVYLTLHVRRWPC